MARKCCHKAGTLFMGNFLPILLKPADFTHKTVFGVNLLVHTGAAPLGGGEFIGGSTAGNTRRDIGR